MSSLKTKVEDFLRQSIEENKITLHPTSRFWEYTNEAMRQSRILRCQGFIDACVQFEKLPKEVGAKIIETLSALYYNSKITVEDLDEDLRNWQRAQN